MHWECKQHGKDCRSYVEEIADTWNKKGYTPNTLPKEEQQFLKCVVWKKGD